MMKRFFCLCVVLCIPLLIFSQEITKKEVLSYNNVKFMETSETLQIKGLIVFSNMNGTDYITILVGDQTAFNFCITQSKTEYETNKKIKVFLGGEEFNGKIIPLQFFKIYDTSKSHIVPETCILQIMNPETGECVQTQNFIGVSRVY